MDEKHNDQKAESREPGTETSGDIGTHCGLDLIHYYRQCKLSPVEHETVQEHLSRCAECTRLLLELRDFERISAGEDAEVESLRKDVMESLILRPPHDSRLIAVMAGGIRIRGNPYCRPTDVANQPVGASASEASTYRTIQLYYSMNSIYGKDFYIFLRRIRPLLRTMLRAYRISDENAAEILGNLLFWLVPKWNRELDLMDWILDVMRFLCEYTPDMRQRVVKPVEGALFDWLYITSEESTADAAEESAVLKELLVQWWLYKPIGEESC